MLRAPFTQDTTSGEGVRLFLWSQFLISLTAAIIFKIYNYISASGRIGVSERNFIIIDFLYRVKLIKTS